MAKYMNIGTTPITVRGVTVKPGETKDLKGFANDRNLLKVVGKKSAPAENKGKVKYEKPEVKNTPPETKPEPAQPEVKPEPEKPIQTESKKDDKQNVKHGGE